jgi:hypothetical protein
MFTRYSPTREPGANHTACTKLTIEDKQALHWMAVERGLSDYELTRRVLVNYIRGHAPARHPESVIAGTDDGCMTGT